MNTMCSFPMLACTAQGAALASRIGEKCQGYLSIFRWFLKTTNCLVPFPAIDILAVKVVVLCKKFVTLPAAASAIK